MYTWSVYKYIIVKTMHKVITNNNNNNINIPITTTVGTERLRKECSRFSELQIVPGGCLLCQTFIPKEQV